MSRPVLRADGNGSRYLLDDKPLQNGDEVEVRLGGNEGWIAVTIDGLPDTLRVRWDADDGKPLMATLPLQTDLRWP